MFAFFSVLPDKCPTLPPHWRHKSCSLWSDHPPTVAAYKQCLWLSVWWYKFFSLANIFAKNMVSPPFFAPASHSKTTFCVAHRNESRLQQSRRCLETGFWMKSRCSSQGEAIEFYQWTFSILRQNVVNITIDKMQYFQGWLNFKIRTW